ncbi:membrane protein [Polaromonas sp.]|nr:membrane protein [Polaromonas sp.]
MPLLMKFLHVLAAIVWLGGIAFMLLALRPVAAELLAPPQRLALMVQVMRRFFVTVWISVAVLLVTGLAILLPVGMKYAPVGWHAMLGIGLLMTALFGHLYFGPYRRLQQAVIAADWAEGDKRIGQITTLVQLNLLLGVVAIAAVFLMF